MVGTGRAGTESRTLAQPAETLSHVGNTRMLMPQHSGRNWPFHWWLNTAGMEKLPSFGAAFKGTFTPCAGSRFFFLINKSKFLASRKAELKKLSSILPTTALPPPSKYGKLHNQQFWGLWAALDERGHRDGRQRKPCSMTWMGILGITQPRAHPSSATHNRTPRHNRTQQTQQDTTGHHHSAPLHLSPSHHQQ